MKIETKITIGLIAFVVAIGIAGVIGELKYKKRIIEEIPDTVFIDIQDSSLVTVNDSLYTVIDSLTDLNMKYKEELTIALFKLDRIKQYNRIAGNGNNIKYLRGWINRTLDEN